MDLYLVKQVYYEEENYSIIIIAEIQLLCTYNVKSAIKHIYLFLWHYSVRICNYLCSITVLSIPLHMMTYIEMIMLIQFTW